jgi:hypothetical protein
MTTSKIALVTLALALVIHSSEAIASGRAMCPGAEGGPAWKEGVGIIATKSTDMEGTVYARGATRCTIKFNDAHKTAPFCMVSNVAVYHITGKVLHTSRSEVTFTFSPSLSTDEGFDYSCLFRD